MGADKLRVLNFYSSKHWAILPETLHEMYRLYTEAIERKEAGIELDVEAVAAKLGRPLDNSHAVKMRDGIAIIPIDGPIFRYANLFTQISGAVSIETLATDFRQAREDSSVKAIILEINSPGGEADGTSELAQHIAESRGDKPVIAYVSNIGASAAYWLASAADEIVVNKAASVGSIGVVCTVCVHKDKNHIELVSSQSPNKRPNVETEGGRARIQTWLDSLADVFINSVAQNRNMSPEDVVEKGQKGDLLVGQQAVDAGLADRLGTLEGLIAELSQNVNENNRVGYRAAALKPTSLQGEKQMADEKDPKDQKTTEETEVKTNAATDPPPADDKDAQIAALRAEVAERDRQLETEKATNAALAKETEGVKSRVADLEKQARTAKFTELAKGWPGATADNLVILESLYAAGGEDSEAFKAHVKTMDAAKAQIDAGALLKEIGSSGPAEGSAVAEVETRARKMADDSDGKLTYHQAYDKILQSDAALASRVAQEEKHQIN